MIKLTAIGHLGKDATLKEVGGQNVINFSVAHSEKYKNSQGEAVEKTTWIDCSYWTSKTGISPYLKKGTQVYVEGTPEVRLWETKDGKQGASLGLRVYSVQLLSGNGEKTQPVASNAQPAESPSKGEYVPVEDDDSPF